MTNEELEKAIDFLVRQQAQFFSDMEGFKIHLEEMKNQQAMTQKHIDHAYSLITTLIERTLSNADAIERNTESINKLSEEVRELTAFTKNHVADKDAHSR